MQQTHIAICSHVSLQRRNVAVLPLCEQAMLGLYIHDKVIVHFLVVCLHWMLPVRYSQKLMKQTGIRLLPVERMHTQE